MTQVGQQLKNNAESDGMVEAPTSATLLFVDDEANILSSLRRLFRPLGYQILTATSGKEGLEFLQKNNVNLIISDMRMPEMDGATFLAQAAEQWPDTVRILLTGYADVKSTVAAINEGKIYKYISKPWEDNDITLSVKYALEQKYLEKDRDRLLQLTRKQNSELQELNASLEDKVKARTEELRQTMAQLELNYKTLKYSYVSSVKVFSNLIEMREGAIAGNSQRVADRAQELALRLGMSKEDAQNVMIAGSLHGIGKVVLPDTIMRTPYDMLNADEKRKFHKYPVIGEGALMALEPLNDAAKQIRHHLEHYDGKGHPDQLKADDIPLGARILAVIIDYESLQNGTFSKEEVSGKQVHDFLLKNCGKRYDPAIVEEFLKLLGDELNKKENFVMVMSNGLEEGMVLAKNIISADDVLLLAKGQILTDGLIGRIQRYENSTEDDVVIYINNTRS